MFEFFVAGIFITLGAALLAGINDFFVNLWMSYKRR